MSRLSRFLFNVETLEHSILIAGKKVNIIKDSERVMTSFFWMFLPAKYKLVFKIPKKFRTDFTPKYFSSEELAKKYLVTHHSKSLDLNREEKESSDLYFKSKLKLKLSYRSDDFILEDNLNVVTDIMNKINKAMKVVNKNTLVI